MNLSALISELKSVLSLEDVMTYCGVEIVSKVGDQWKARCWRHDDKIPSINISTRSGLYHCFSTGCEASGDVVTFVSQWNSLETSEAARWLASEFGLDASPHLDQSEEEKALGRYRVLTSGLVKTFHASLLKSKGALAYVKKRGVSSEAIESFQLGYCASVKEAIHVATKLGASKTQIKTLGLFGESQFGDTILFPIYHRGAPAFFYSKPLRGTDKDGPKYVGPSASHPLFAKEAMFGLQMARKEARTGLVLVEGFFDTLVLQSMGFYNTVGMLGSSPRVEQMGVLASIHVPGVKVLFDADKAGEAGAKKAIEARQGDVQIRVAFCPEGDPDEFVLKNGPEALRVVLDESVGAADYLMGTMIDRLMGGDLDERAKTLLELSRLSSKLSGHEAAIMMKSMSDATGIPIDELKEVTASEDDKAVVQDEAVVLAACLKDETCLLEAMSKFRGRDVWFLSKHRAIWSSIVSLRKQGVVEYTSDLIREAAHGVHLNGTLDSLLDRQVSNFEYHLGAVVDGHARRGLRRLGRRLAAGAGDTAKTVSSLLTEHLSAVSKEAAPDAHNEFTSQQQVESAMDYIHERMEAGGKIPGLDMGGEWKSLTEATLGWQKGHMNLISALPKRGKTTLVMNWARSLSIERRIPGLWLNFEMNRKDLALRFLSMLSGVSNTRLRMGAISVGEKEKVDEAAQKYYAAPFYVVDAASLSLQEVINTMRKYVWDKGVQYIVLDYIQLIRKSDPRAAYWEHHQSISTELKNAVTTLDVPLLGISQLSKAAIEGGSAAHQGGAFKYLQDCDCAMEVRPLTDEEKKESPMANMRLNIEFSRHGQQEVYFNMLFDHTTLRVGEI